MARIKGSKEYQRFKAGETLTHRQAILAQCYICNGADESGGDCKGKSCSLYQFMPYRGDKLPQPKRELTLEQRKSIGERLKRGRERQGGYLTPNQQEII